jgi:hypothetical protein
MIFSFEVALFDHLHNSVNLITSFIHNEMEIQENKRFKNKPLKTLLVDKPKT